MSLVVALELAADRMTCLRKEEIAGRIGVDPIGWQRRVAVDHERAARCRPRARCATLFWPGAWQPPSEAQPWFEPGNSPSAVIERLPSCAGLTSAHAPAL